MNYFDTEVLRKIHTAAQVVVKGYDGELLITKKYIGDIYLPTGEIVVFAPERRYISFLAKKEPLVDKVNPGTYKVNIYYADNDRGRRIAFFEIEFNGNKPERYTLALNTVDKYAKVKPGKAFGFTVFTKKASFADIETLKILNENVLKKTKDIVARWRRDLKIDDELYVIRNTNDDRYGSITIDNDGRNVMTFDVENGNFYPSFWGIDKDGNKCCLITDILLHE